MLLFCSRVQDTLTCCCSQFSTASPSYFTHTKYVQIVVPEFTGDINSPSYLIKCSHVPPPKTQGGRAANTRIPKKYLITEIEKTIDEFIRECRRAS